MEAKGVQALAAAAGGGGGGGGVRGADYYNAGTFIPTVGARGFPRALSLLYRTWRDRFWGVS